MLLRQMLQMEVKGIGNQADARKLAKMTKEEFQRYLLRHVHPSNHHLSIALRKWGQKNPG